MQPGRAPSWNIVADLEDGAWLESVQLASGARLALPVSLRKRVTWCATADSLPLLAVIGPDGGATLAPLSTRKDELSAVSQAIRSSDPTERADLALTAMATYSQISLQPDGRLRLSPILAAHLSPEPDGWIWVGAHADRITLWSGPAWNRKLQSTAPALRDAVAAAGGG